MAYVQKRKLPKKKQKAERVASENVHDGHDAPEILEQPEAVAVEPIDVEPEIAVTAEIPSVKSPHNNKKAKKTALKTAESVDADTEEDDADADDNGEEEGVADEEQEEQATDLSSIYGLDDDTPVDMTKLDQKRTRGRWIIGLLLILGLLSAVVYLGYRIFHEGGSKDGAVRVAIAAESRVASGDVVSVDITYTNTKNVPISSGTIEVFYPDGFQPQSAEPESTDARNRTWSVSTVAPGAGGRIHIVGQLVGAKDDVKDFSVIFTYRPSNFSQDFQETAKTSVTITSSIVGLKVDAPTQVASNQELTYTVEYTNTSKLALNNIKLLMTYPEGFAFTSASQTPRSNNNEWYVDTLQAGETQTLTIQGTLTGDSGSTKEFAFQLGLIEIDNSFDIQVSKTSSVVVVNPEVELSINAPSVVQAGTDVSIDVVVTNTSDIKMKDVVVQLSMSGALFGTTEHAFDTIKELAPDDKKTLNISIPLKSDASGDNQALQLVAKVTSAHVSGSSVTFPNQAEVTMKVGGTMTLGAEGRYFDDQLEKIGSGPIPPTVGKKTTYVIQWEITNQQNSMETVHVVTTLPAHVTWEDDASSALSYDESTRQVSYTKDTVSPDTETALHFAVSVTPASSDVNKLLVLTNETTLTATNSFTEEQVTANIARITTDLPNDEGAAGKGVVEK